MNFTYKKFIEKIDEEKEKEYESYYRDNFHGYFGSSIKRIIKDLVAYNRNPVFDISAGPNTDSDLLHWQGTILGPINTPYQGGVFFSIFVSPKIIRLNLLKSILLQEYTILTLIV